MRRAEALQRITAAFENAGYILPSGDVPAVALERVTIVVSVQVMVVAPWLGPYRCQIRYSDGAYSWKRLVERAEKWAANYPPPDPPPPTDRTIPYVDEHGDQRNLVLPLYPVTIWQNRYGTPADWTASYGYMGSTQEHPAEQGDSDAAEWWGWDSEADGTPEAVRTGRGHTPDAAYDDLTTRILRHGPLGAQEWTTPEDTP